MREKEQQEKKEGMPAVWVSLKRSLHCSTDPSDVRDPKPRGHPGSILTRKPVRSGCSRSIANLRDVVIHGSRRHLGRPPSCSPRSIGSSEFLNPITHEVVLSNSTCELKITGLGGGGKDSTAFVGTLRPGTPGPGWHHSSSPLRGASSNGAPLRLRRSISLFPERMRAPSKAVPGDVVVGGAGVRQGYARGRGSCDAGSIGSGAGGSCHKCGESFKKWESVEAHHLNKHAVTELAEGDSSRKIVEMICKTSWLNSESARIERILKVHNTQKTLARFEEYREMVKNKVSKLPKKHPRCLADGNELLRFHGTVLACALGMDGSSNLCDSESCKLCGIIRHGFPVKKEQKGGVGVFTTSTSGRAFESIQVYEENMPIRKALLVCRVIAGRVHRPVENFQEFAGQSGFDSLAGKVGLHSNIEELYLLNPRALLPCFVVIYRP